MELIVAVTRKGTNIRTLHQLMVVAFPEVLAVAEVVVLSHPNSKYNKRRHIMVVMIPELGTVVVLAVDLVVVTTEEPQCRVPSMTMS